jgi:hypothetical protein
VIVSLFVSGIVDTSSAVQEFNDTQNKDNKSNFGKNLVFIKNHLKFEISFLIMPSGHNGSIDFLKRREVFCSSVLRSFPTLKQPVFLALE